jgi:1,2-diacylglycerol 3-beta-galactosyltransferase
MEGVATQTSRFADRAREARTDRTPQARTDRPPPAPTVLFLISDTGAGHRRAAEAIIEAMTQRDPPVRAVLCDPLLGPAAGRSLRWLAGLYGPAVRVTPWLWGAAYYVSNSRPAMFLLWRTSFSPANRVVRAQVAATRPAAIVSCHPLTGRAAMLAARRDPDRRVPVVTVVTDLAAVHASWRAPLADLLIVPTAAARARCVASGVPAVRCADSGLPVDARARAGRLTAAARASLRRSLGLPEHGFVVLLGGGGEGCGRLARRAAAILRRLGDVHVVAACGRNDRARGKLARLAGPRLTVLDYVDNFTDWLRCADVAITKAGPGVIAEAACCGTPLLLTSHLPGQERGNAALVVRAGAGQTVRGIRGMARALAQLRAAPQRLAAMQAATHGLARPGAAAAVAEVIAGLARARDRAAPGGSPAAESALAAVSAASATVSAGSPAGVARAGRRMSR